MCIDFLNMFLAGIVACENRWTLDDDISSQKHE